MSWQALILFHAFAGSFLTLQSRALARTKLARHASTAINAVAFTAVFVGGVLYVLLTGSVNWGQASDFMPLMILAATCFALSSVYMYRALAYMESAIVSVVMTTSSLFTLLLAGLFLGERLSITQAAGVALLLPCIWFVLLLANKEKQGFGVRSLPWLRGSSHAMLASVLVAIGTVLEKHLLDNITPTTYIGVGFGLQMIVAWGFVLVFRRSTLKVLRSVTVATQAVRLGAIRAVAGIAFLYALVLSDSVSLVSVVANFRIILVTILAAMLLKERDHLQQKMLASALAFVALSIIFWK